MKWFRKIWTKWFGKKPRTLKDAHFDAAISVATLKETAQEYVWQPGEPCAPGHELDGTEFRSFRR